ncbi:hypothetical protein LB572_11600 [Mesorhizobium sp. BH1-1-5]|uniref:hypothetical protein n=1 Tax=Mesorhizobium sp. BH1-1-5 TaxID=2876661 RepID=UPI001CD035C2|nr:hypothetical protein [Mesorhizobium sp. BH1-1-5]MBZ9987738.1 hypothetical protein [Mesorhizobium sp. BH1-1-5]
MELSRRVRTQELLRLSLPATSPLIAPGALRVFEIEDERSTDERQRRLSNCRYRPDS